MTVAPSPAATGPTDPSALRTASRKLEAQILQEFLRAARFGEAPEGFGGGAGEEQFASFLREAVAEKMVARRYGAFGDHFPRNDASPEMTDLRREIEQLLADETAAMACLSQSELESCLERRTVLADRLAEAGQEDLSALAGTPRRHDRRLAATAAGIRAGLRRISELRSARTGLRTYSADGDADEIGRDPGRLSRKA